MNLTLTLDEYLHDLRVNEHEVWVAFNDWLDAVGISPLACFELSIEAGESATLRLKCYDKVRSPIDGRHHLVAGPDGRAKYHVEQFTPRIPPPPEFMRWLLTRGDPCS